MLCCAAWQPRWAVAAESISLDIDKISYRDWSLQQVQIWLSALNADDANLALRASKLSLPSPLNRIQLFDVECSKFSWHADLLQCDQGRGRVEAGPFSARKFTFSFKVTSAQTRLQIKHWSLFGGSLSVEAVESDGNWQMTLMATEVALAPLRSLFNIRQLTQLSGTVTGRLELQGNGERVRQLKVVAEAHQVAFQDKADKRVAESMHIGIVLHATRGQAWQWQADIHVPEGQLYVEPVFLALTEAQSLLLNASGTWQPDAKSVAVDQLAISHADIARARLQAAIDYRDSLRVHSARISVDTEALEKSAPVYLKPFLEAGSFAQLMLAGRLHAELDLVDEEPVALALQFGGVEVADPLQRLSLHQGSGSVHWHATKSQRQASFIDWQELRVYAIPFDAGHLDFALYGRQFDLLKKSVLSVLNGYFTIHHFGFAMAEAGDADVHFKGAIDQLSLARLTEVLQWKPLSGTLSGTIPSVRYQNRTLTLNGQINVQVFDGEIRIRKLASSGLFSGFPQLHTDLEFDRLDLQAITRKFDFGSIEGRLSGFARDVYLENWQPVTFTAWLGTPDNDDSRHKISQKAVENIASIGGGGAVDLLSRSFLRFFENFGYDKLGFGCYLHNGVCQVMGVEPAENGYYLVKGGGLPRIDVIGYNPRLDWDILIKRLRRVLNPAAAVIQ